MEFALLFEYFLNLHDFRYEGGAPHKWVGLRFHW